MISVVDVDKMIRSVRAAMKPSNVVGDDGTNGGLWCSPVAKTSRPTSSAFSAILTVAWMRSASVGVRPVDRVGRDISDGEDAELHGSHGDAFLESW